MQVRSGASAPPVLESVLSVVVLATTDVSGALLVLALSSPDEPDVEPPAPLDVRAASVSVSAEVDGQPAMTKTVRAARCFLCIASCYTSVDAAHNWKHRDFWG